MTVTDADRAKARELALLARSGVGGPKLREDAIAAALAEARGEHGPRHCVSVDDANRVLSEERAAHERTAAALAEAEAEAERRLDALIDVRAKRDALVAALAAARAEADGLRADMLALAEQLDDHYETGGAFGAGNLRAADRLRALAGNQP
jgi:hypothetical protein